MKNAAQSLTAPSAESLSPMMTPIALSPAPLRSWKMYARPLRETGRTLVILGEAPGADEERYGQPFIGPSGELLRKRLFPDAGLDVSNWHILNTFEQRPPNNDLDKWTANKTELKKFGLTPQGDPFRKRYLLPEYRWMLEELDTRLKELKPDLILCLGGAALWAVSGESAITNFRGNFFQSRYGTALATFHPAATLRQWSNMPLTWADLKKVRLWLEGTLPAPLKRRLWVNPTFAEIENLYWRFKAHPNWLLGVDIETAPSTGQITTISFATAREGICIPFWDRYAAAGHENYWPTVEDEVRAWRWVDRFSRLPNAKVMQNGLYDMQYLLDAPLPVRVWHTRDDTAIMQHALQPELPKALGTLSSLYLNEPSWKQMRTKTKDMNKADE